MTKLHINVLGCHQITWNGYQPISMETKKCKAILFILALNKGKPLARETIANRLWEIQGDSISRVAANFRQSLYSVKKALGDNADKVLYVDNDFCQLISDNVVVDLWDFNRMAQRQQPKEYTTMMEMYEGELLEGFRLNIPNFENWLIGERMSLQNKVLRTFKTLITRTEHLERFDLALELAYKMLEIDPLQEEAHRKVMTIYANTGERARALKHYETCRNLLRRELGVNPDANTSKCHRDILTNEGGMALSIAC